ncbi:MAG: hypothetical protein RL412_482 [Pseudomonadota bacterium]|jgi:hypothetical protein
MRLIEIYRPVVALLVAFTLVSPAAWASDSSDKARRPPPKPDPRSRAIPELVCTGERAVTVKNEELGTQTEEAPLRLRLRGNLLYLGETAVNERFFGLINRSDRRRWVSGSGTLILDEALEKGVWIRLTLDSTRISSVYCEPFGKPSIKK